MADKRTKNEFGIDASVLRTLDWKLAASRVLSDIRSDFIFAPQLSSIFRHASAELIASVNRDLKNGVFAPSPPITIEVPKSTRMPAPHRNVGPSFSRPGSILLPKDRLLYQAIADVAAPLIEKHTDRTRSYSHRLASKDSTDMFLPSRDCWSAMQAALGRFSRTEPKGYVLKADVANCFGAINQHLLVNLLASSGFASALGGALDSMLVLFTGDRSSRGLIQGVYPSDLLGAFYLTPIDQHFADLNVPSARYVDDLYIFVPSMAEAERMFRSLTAALREWDLTLNEAKSKLIASHTISYEEPNLDELFSDAIEELTRQMKAVQLAADYGFQAEWADEDEESQVHDLELQATAALFASMSKFVGHEEKIERFCLPAFATAGSDYAVAHVIENFRRRPSMTQVYCTYLRRFINDGRIKAFLESLLTDREIYFDWQRMWILGTLLASRPPADTAVRTALRIFEEGKCHIALRAIAAIYVAKVGQFTRQKAVADQYANSTSHYLQSALIYASRYFSGALRNTARKQWSAHSELHKLVSIAVDAL